MTDWTAARIRDAAAEWVWVPEGADEVRNTEYHLVAYPSSFAVPTQVAWCRSERNADSVVAEVLETVRAWGRPEVSFWLDDSTRPVDLRHHLLALGAELAETVEVLALRLDRSDPDLLRAPYEPGVTVKVVTDEATLRDADLVSTEVWGHAERTPQEDARLLAELAKGTSRELRVVGYVDGEPACSGGCTTLEGAARLWGAATRPAYRGRGAYRAVLAERLRIARDRGASLGLVRGVVTTSAPILRRLGFEGYGLSDRYRLAL